MGRTGESQADIQITKSTFKKKKKGKRNLHYYQRIENNNHRDTHVRENNLYQKDQIMKLVQTHWKIVNISKDKVKSRTTSNFTVQSRIVEFLERSQ